MEPINFDNTQVAFAHKSDADLKKARFLFRLFNYKWLIAVGPKLARAAMDIGIPVKPMIRNTIFSQFCGGENIEDCQNTAGLLWKNHIGTILDYSAEGQENEEGFEQTLQETLRTVQFATQHEYISYCVFKITGIARFALLEKWNAGTKLSPDEEQEKERVKARFDKICATAHQHGIKVLVDAEESWIQDVIDQLAMEAMHKYNREKAIVFNTIQLYRHDRLEYLKKCIADAHGFNIKAGFKLVRGAYMEKERKRAEKIGYPSPIQEDKAASDKDYNKALRLCIENIDVLSLVAGTHNEESSRLLTQLMEQASLSKSDDRIWFSQLLGMSDHISFNLAAQGYLVCKYVPYGPVKELLPYLSRRAQENSSVAGQAGRELQLIEKELKRRSAK